MQYLVKGREGKRAGIFRVCWKTVYREISAETDKEAKKKMDEIGSLVDRELFKRVVFPS